VRAQSSTGDRRTYRAVCLWEYIRRRPSLLGAILHRLPAGEPLNVAGTATLAASCDRLLPGAGRWPWLAVAGIYAVPVGWNLVTIGGAV